MTEQEGLNLLTSIIKLAMAAKLDRSDASSMTEARMRLALAQIERLARETLRDAGFPGAGPKPG